MSARGILVGGIVALLAEVASAQPMTFEQRGTGGNCSTCQWIAAEGEIGTETYRALEVYLYEHGGGRYIVLDSPGGNLFGGLLLGEVIRNAGLTTRIGRTVPDIGNFHRTVAGSCFSACAFAFLGGVERDFDGRLGFHQFFDEAALAQPELPRFNAIDFSTNQLVTGIILEYVVRMGVDARVVALASRTPPNAIYELSLAEAEELRVSWRPNDFRPWQIEAYGDGLVAFSKSYDEHLTLTLYCANGRRALLFTEDMTVASPGQHRVFFPEAITGARAIDVLGTTVAPAAIRVVEDGEATRVTFSLPEGFVAGASSQISNINHAPHVYWFGVQASGEGLAVNAALAFRNCI